MMQYVMVVEVPDEYFEDDMDIDVAVRTVNEHFAYANKQVLASLDPSLAIGGFQLPLISVRPLSEVIAC